MLQSSNLEIQDHHGSGRAAQGMPLRVAPAKIACLDFNLQKAKMQMGVQVLVTGPRELERIRQREADMTKERIEKILKAGANVILTTKGIDDMALKYVLIDNSWIRTSLHLAPKSLALEIAQFYTDLYMRRAILSSVLPFKPDVVLFLGDYFDGGDKLSDEDMVDIDEVRSEWADCVQDYVYDD